MLEQLESQFVLMQQHQVCIAFSPLKFVSILSIFIDSNIISEHAHAHFYFLPVFVKFYNLFLEKLMNRDI